MTTTTERIEQLLTAAAEYKALGLRVLPLGQPNLAKPDDAKGCHLKNWQSKNFTLAQIERQLKRVAAAGRECGIGAAMGPNSGLVDIETDNDSQVADLLDLFDGVVPETCEFGATRGPHRLFAWDDRLDTIGAGSIHWGGLEIKLGAAGLGSQSALPPTRDRAWAPGKSLAERKPAALPEAVIEKLLAKKRAPAPTHADWNEFVWPGEAIENVRARLANLPDAIEGAGREKESFRAARLICESVGNQEQAEKLWDEYDATKCSPSYRVDRGEAYFARKFEEAAKRGVRSDPREDFDLIEGYVDATPYAAPDATPDAKPKRFSLETIDGVDFLACEFHQEFLVDRAIVAGEHLVIGGGKKSLKTSVAVALGVSLATGAPFLGEFAIPRRRRVLVISGESGKATLQKTLRRILRAQGVQLERGYLRMSFKRPQLRLPEHLAAIRREIEAGKFDLVVVDPTYLCARPKSGETSKLFDMGEVLAGFGELGEVTGATVCLVHHSTKTSQREKPGMPDLDDLSGSGLAEWSRQWILLNRQSPMRHGRHKLAMRLGGSAAGDLGEWLLEVNEGQPDGEILADQLWEVAVTPWDDAVADAARAAEDAKEMQLALDVSKVRSLLLAALPGDMAPTTLRDSTGIRSTKLEKVLAELDRARELVRREARPGHLRYSIRAPERENATT